MSIVARAVATTAGLLIIATAVSFMPSNAWWIRVWDFPRLQIAVAGAVVLGATLAFVPRGRSRGILLAGVTLALLAQVTRLAPYTRLVAPEVARADSCGEGTHSSVPMSSRSCADSRIALLSKVVATLRDRSVLAIRTKAAHELLPLRDDLPPSGRVRQHAHWDREDER